MAPVAKDMGELEESRDELETSSSSERLRFSQNMSAIGWYGKSCEVCGIVCWRVC